jgi:hypothetical protein
MPLVKHSTYLILVFEHQQKFSDAHRSRRTCCVHVARRRRHYLEIVANAWRHVAFLTPGRDMSGKGKPVKKLAFSAG